jgi:hypothetical protein
LALVTTRQIGEWLFTDGTTRPVFEHADGRRHALDADGEPVYGVWISPPDESFVVHAVAGRIGP